MILVIGGLSSGKRTYVKESLGFRDEDISSSISDGAPVVCDVQELLRQGSRQDLVPLLLEKQVVICNEVGCGIVPFDEADRIWREEVGRTCGELAQQATLVVRIYCGLPTVLKGSV